MIAALAILLLAAIGARADDEFGGTSLNGTGPFIDRRHGLSAGNIAWIVSVSVSLVASACVLVYVLRRRRQQRKLWADAERNGMVHRPSMMVQNPQWVAASTEPGYGFPAPSSQAPQPQQLQAQPAAPFVLPAHPSFSSSTVNHVDPSPFADSNGWRELQASAGVVSTDNLHEAKDKPQRALSIGKKPGEMETEFQFPKRSMSEDSHPDSPTENMVPVPHVPEPAPAPAYTAIATPEPATTSTPEPTSVPLPDDSDNGRRSSEPEVPMLQITSPDGISGGFHFDEEDSDSDEDQHHDDDNHHSAEHHRRESSESENGVYPPGLPIVTVHAPPTDAPDNRHV